MKFHRQGGNCDLHLSPSMRREWIEMILSGFKIAMIMSPSMRREWIEISLDLSICFSPFSSPSMRREWIEMLPAENLQERLPGLPPCGGSGLKFFRYDG